MYITIVLRDMVKIVPNQNQDINMFVIYPQYLLVRFLGNQIDQKTNVYEEIPLICVSLEIIIRM